MNLAEVLLQGASTHPDGTAITAPDRVTYGQLADRARRLVSRLAETVERGDRVALLAGNDAAFVHAYLATLAAGGVAVPLNEASPSLELARELAIVEPALVGLPELFSCR